MKFTEFGKNKMEFWGENGFHRALEGLKKA